MVQGKNRTGYNMLISAQLYLNARDVVKDSVETIYYIPHYIIVDKKGKIAYANAARPGEDILYNQLQRMYSIKKKAYNTRAAKGFFNIYANPGTLR